MKEKNITKKIIELEKEINELMEENGILRLKEGRQDNKFSLRLAGIIFTGILGCITLVGIFFGDQSLLKMGLTILALLIACMLGAAMSGFD